MLGILSTALAIGEQTHPARYRRLNARPTSSPVPPAFQLVGGTPFPGIHPGNFAPGNPSRWPATGCPYQSARSSSIPNGHLSGRRLTNPAGGPQESMDLTNRPRPAGESVTTERARARLTPRLSSAVRVVTPGNCGWAVGARVLSNVPQTSF